MSEVASRELRNQTRSLLDRVAAGERITITVGGRPAALLMPVANKRLWMSRSDFQTSVLRHQADSRLADDLIALGGETTDDLPLG